MDAISVKRIEWVDVAKGIGIFLVVLGHTSAQLRNLIYGFHMPLFFFLSGVVFNREKYSINDFVKNRFNTLILPYIFFYVLTYVYWLLIERSMRSFDCDWWQPILGLFYGSQWHDLMIHNGILWFLPCLFLTQLIVYMATGVRNRILMIFILVACVIIGLQFEENLPWGLNIALVASQFFFIGWVVKKSIPLKFDKKWLSILCAIVLFFFYVIGKMRFHNEVNMGECIYSNVYLFEIFSYIGITGTILLSAVIGLPTNRILTWLGKNSLVIFAIHQPVSRIIRFIVERTINGIDVQQNVLLSILVTIVILFVLWPLVLMYNKYCKPLLEKIYIH